MQVHISRKKEMEIRNVFSNVKSSISSGIYLGKLRRFEGFVSEGGNI